LKERHPSLAHIGEGNCICAMDMTRAMYHGPFLMKAALVNYPNLKSLELFLRESERAQLLELGY
jgi:hypothetical protein